MLFFIVLAIFAGGYAYYALTRDFPPGKVTVIANQESTPEDIEITWPEQGQAAIGTLEGGVLARSHDDEQPRPIASLAKVITALAVLEKAPMESGETGIIITYDAADELSYNEYLAKLGTVTNVAAGEQINQYQALQAMLLPSSNNMSDTLAKRVFGSMEAYKVYANNMLLRYGLSKTKIDDASGFSPTSVSTPSEMIVIGQKALEHPVIAEIVRQPNAELPLSGEVPNYNGLLRVEGVTGIKPGTTDEAGWCLLFSATHRTATNQDMTVIGVLLGEDNPYELLDASENLLKVAKSNLEQAEVIKGGDIVGSYTTPWGESVDIIAQESLWVHTLSGHLPQISHKQTEPSYPVSVNQKLGEIQLTRDSNKVVQVVSSADVSSPPLLWRLRRPLQQLGISR